MSVNGRLIVLTGPSGVGKDTVLREAVHPRPVARVLRLVHDRPPRPGEIEGVSYFFVDEEAFRAMIDRGEFFEWSTVYGELKGRTFETVNRSLASGKDTVIKIDVQGPRRCAPNGRRRYLHLPTAPSLDALEQRLIERGRRTRRASAHARTRGR